MKQITHAASLCIAILLAASLSIAVSGCGPSAAELRSMAAERQRDDALRAWKALNDGNKEQALRLIKGGVDARVKNKHGFTLLHVAAVNTNQWEAIILLLQQGADVNAKTNDGETPLHQAAFYGDVTTASVLLENGAAVNATDKDGDTPLDEAILGGGRSVEVQSLLKRYGGR